MLHRLSQRSRCENQEEICALLRPQSAVPVLHTSCNRLPSHIFCWQRHTCDPGLLGAVRLLELAAVLEGCKLQEGTQGMSRVGGTESRRGKISGQREQRRGKACWANANLQPEYVVDSVCCKGSAHLQDAVHHTTLGHFVNEWLGQLALRSKAARPQCEVLFSLQVHNGRRKQVW
eukprot:scaffold307630_cov21-Tisochrysis_lutea.AAC.1